MSELRERVRGRYAAAARVVEHGHAANDWDEVARCAGAPDGGVDVLRSARRIGPNARVFLGANIRATKA